MKSEQRDPNNNTKNKKKKVTAKKVERWGKRRKKSCKNDAFPLSDDGPAKRVVVDSTASSSSSSIWNELRRELGMGEPRGQTLREGLRDSLKVEIDQVQLQQIPRSPFVPCRRQLDQGPTKDTATDTTTTKARR